MSNYFADSPLGRRRETEFRFLFSNREDPERIVYLTVLAFHVPTEAD
jgi:hypothetical protein